MNNDSFSKKETVFYKKVCMFCRRRPVWQKILFFCIVALVIVHFALVLLPYPRLESFMHRQNSTRFYDRNGVLLQVLPLDDGLRRETYPLDEIPTSLQKEFIQAEDKNFYYHLGVDFVSIVRAAIQNKKAGRVVSGASTITMQLVRMVYPRKTISGTTTLAPVTLRVKFIEMIHAFHIEAKLSKKKILELYLNNVPFGFQAEGVGSAARTFFGVEPNALSSEQIKILAQIPRRPSEYAPRKSFVYPQLCPHLITYVLSQYKAQNKGIPNSLILSVDSNLCAQAEKDIQQKLEDYKDARIHNGSAFVINNVTGEILAWVGNGNFFDEHGGQIDGVLVKNQPGSSMKPFLYALALEQGYAPTTVLPDIPQDFGSSKVYVPLNFNDRYNGPVRMRVALASSLNIPAVYLLYNIGVTDYMKKLSELGFRSLDGQRESTGLSLALGSGEVTLYEMVRAFSVFPRDGTLPKLRFTKALSAVARRGKVAPTSVDLQTDGGVRVYKADTTRIICDFLSDKSARSLGFGHAKVFDTPYPCIFKTGTSNQFQNIIALGATSECTAGVWLGNFEGETVIRQTGSSIPAAIVRDLLDTLTKQKGAHEFLPPQSFTKQSICVLSGMRATPDCPAVTQEYISDDTSAVAKKNSTLKTVAECTWHYRENGRVQIRYPSEYQHWAAGRNMSGSFATGDTALQFLYPTDGAVFVYDPTVPREVQHLRIEVVGGNIPQAELFVDNKSAGRVAGRFFWNIPLEQGTHMLSVVCGDEERTIYFSVE
jgi:penicillin-binding protein 1C